MFKSSYAFSGVNCQGTGGVAWLFRSIMLQQPGRGVSHNGAFGRNAHVCCRRELPV